MPVKNKYNNTSKVVHVSKTTTPHKGSIGGVSHKIERESLVIEAQIPEKKLTKKATFELPVELHKRLKTAAAEQEMTMVQIVEKALENYLKS
ncbi:toxin-antitoxin system HicB family antitoxin [Paenisporosarcina sp. TG20]|uniref:toxin-antitoxin system HicB family antitoxin n=1 Tax=Paenisporosarcina sp. TG20 TaxID=1211706 RepID=UPI0003004C8B|nr:toxin-antitoxin system HicB family antitoxin [Paenisporosarcina sp. TG20]